MRTYMPTAELNPIMDELISTKEYHNDLHVTGATVQVLFHFGGAGETLVHRGVACFAYIKATPTTFRACGIKDAIIVVDSTSWE